MMRYKVLVVLVAAVLVLSGAAAEMELPAALVEIEAGAFEGDAALEGVVVLPEGVRSVGSRAFAETGLHALVIPEGCASLAADALAGGQAAYVRMNGADTAVSGDELADVPFVFAPAGSGTESLPGFYAAESLTVQDGWLYSLTETEAIPLCAADGTAVSGMVMLPKLVGGLPVLSLEVLVTKGCGEMTELQVPSYLDIPAELAASTYPAMSVSAPVPDVTEAVVGDQVTWTTSVTGAWGDVAYIWTFDTDGVVYSTITAAPTVTWTPEAAGACVASVEAVDALDDRACASGAAVTVEAAVPEYRALLIGNIYEGQSNSLDGCDTDVASMRAMLSAMIGTPYSVTAHVDLTSAEIEAAIASAFADARSCDVSLFHFSGHGTSVGSIVGVGGGTISVSKLRSCLDQIPGTKIIIVDACYSGNMIGKSTDAADPSAFTSAFISGFSSYTKDNLASNGYIVMTACSKDQRSQTLTDGTIAFGAFTYGVCYGSGYDEWNQRALNTLPADADANGAITLGEAYATALDRVAYLTTMVSTMDQAAQFYGDTAFVLWSK